ncbi:MAG TPA: chromosomal replication initiator protein DnaA [Pyrinomonadaceae bacterium]|nr:chromosomal replication initiator protein DnaA [Pyrinomonadaceae bacterium]
MHTVNQDTQYQTFFQAVQRRLSRQAFETWFRPLRLSRNPTEQVLRISTPNQVVKDWILAKYARTLEESLAESNLGSLKVEWATAAVGPTEFTGSPAEVPAFSEDLIDGKDPAPDFALSDLAHLNDKYTFSSLVVASCNRLAHAAAKAVADAPGQTYNPLYIYGGVGLGKTHLIQATGHAIAAAKPNLKIAYLSLERFMNELISAIRYGYDKTNAFRERYRSIDVLLIDDVQFIAGKERTQEEFFHTFNALYDRQKQIVLTSDCAPRDIPEIEERLHSRFEWGLIADIEPPDLETKVAIVKRKAESQSVELPDDVALCLAKHSKHNIRELEGSLIRLLAVSSLRGVPLTRTLAEDSLHGVTNQPSDQTTSIARIQKLVAEHYKIDVATLKARSNVRQFLLPRQVAMYLCKRLAKKSYPEIARHFGGKHHTTVIHSVEKIEEEMKSNHELATTITRMIEAVNS